MTPRRVATNLALAVGAVVVVLAALETTCRLLERAGIIAAPPVLDVALNPPFSARLKRSDDPILFVEHDPADPLLNSSGFRGPEVAERKPPGTFRIAAIGDSVTFGFGVPFESAYPKQLEDLLNRGGHAGVRYEVLNFGVSSYGTQQELEVLRRQVLRYDPDLVLLGYVLNDPLPPEFVVRVIQQSVEESRRPLRVLARHSRVAALVAARLEALRQAREAPAQYAEAYAHPQAWPTVAESLAEFGRIARARGIRVAVVIFPLLVDFGRYPFGDFHARVREELDKNALPYLDLYDVLRSEDATALRLAPLDNTHLNAPGHRAVAEHIARFLTTRHLLEAAGHSGMPRRLASTPAADTQAGSSSSSSTTCTPLSTLGGNPSTNRDGLPSARPVVRSKMSIG